MKKIVLLIFVFASLQMSYAQVEETNSIFINKIIIDFEKDGEVLKLPYHKYLFLEIINAEGFESFNYSIKEIPFKKKKNKKKEIKNTELGAKIKEKKRICKESFCNYECEQCKNLEIEIIELISEAKQLIKKDNVALSDGKHSEFLPVLKPNRVYILTINAEKNEVLDSKEKEELIDFLIKEESLLKIMESILKKKLFVKEFLSEEEESSIYTNVLDQVVTDFENEYSQSLVRFRESKNVNYSIEELGNNDIVVMKNAVAAIHTPIMTGLNYLKNSENANIENDPLSFLINAKLTTDHVLRNQINKTDKYIDENLYNVLDKLDQIPEGSEREKYIIDNKILEKKCKTKIGAEVKVFENRSDLDLFINEDDPYVLYKYWLVNEDDFFLVKEDFMVNDLELAKKQLKEDKMEDDLQEIIKTMLSQTVSKTKKVINVNSDTYVTGTKLEDYNGVNVLVSNGILWSPHAGINSFTTFNILFSNRQKGYPIAFYRGDTKTWLRYRTYFSVGITSSDVNSLATTSNKQYSGLIGNKALLIGGGLQLHDLFSVEFGTMILNKKSNNPLSNDKVVRASGYLGATFTINFNQLLKNQ